MDCDFMFSELLFNDFAPLQTLVSRIDKIGIGGTRCVES